MKIFNRSLHPICILVITCLLPAATTAETGYDRLVVLGDSLSDPGNASVLTGMSVADGKVSSSQTDNVFSSALFPGFPRPDRHNLTTGMADSRRGADPRFTLKPIGADIHWRNGLDEPSVVDNLLRLRF
jgi:phospholipase/lecithinase/hemolysin